MRELLAHNLRAYRKARGLSQEELAYRADIHRTYMSAIERSAYSATVDVLDKLAQALGVEPADLLRMPGEPLVEPTANAEPAERKSVESPARKGAKPKRGKT